MNPFSHIICIPDLLRTTRAASDGFFDLVREPIRQGCGVDIGHAPGGKKPNRLLPGFDVQRFRALAQASPPVPADTLWATTYHRMPDAAVDYLYAHLPTDTLLLSYEMPPWLRQACLARNIPFIDLRLSPLRFGRDLYVALDTSQPVLRARLATQAVSNEELRLEAALLGANLRTHRTRLQEGMEHSFSLDGTLVFARQQPNDVALLAPEGHFQQAQDFAERLHTLAAGRPLLFMIDYLDGYMANAAEQERADLSALLGIPIRACPQSTYQILSAHDEVELVGISAPLLQEAAWFDKPAHWLAQPFTPLAPAHAPQHGGYLQMHFRDLLAPAFWHQILAPNAPPPRLPYLPTLDRHHGREMLDEWGEYEKVLHWERPLPWQAFERSGGIVQRHRIDTLEKIQLSTRPAEPANSALPGDSMQARIRSLKDTKAGQTAYILGNAPSLMELDIKQLMDLESFWCNRSFEMEAQGFNYCPKYYFLWDPIGLQKWPDEIMGIKAGIKFFGKEAYSFAQKMYPEEFDKQNILSLTAISRRPGNFMFDSEDNFSYDPSISIYDGGTVILFAIQVAFYMGYSKVLIGGVDLDYSNPYFYGENHSRIQSDMDTILEYMKKSFPMARKHFEKNGRILAKITHSPNLPLDYFDFQEIRKKAE